MGKSKQDTLSNKEVRTILKKLLSSKIDLVGLSSNNREVVSVVSFVYKNHSQMTLGQWQAGEVLDCKNGERFVVDWSEGLSYVFPMRSLL